MPAHNADSSNNGRGRDGDAVTLVKGRHTWIFSWSAGDEPALLHTLQELAENSTGGFEWFDAAVVCHQLSRRLGIDLGRFIDTDTEPRHGSRTRTGKDAGRANPDTRRP